MATTIQVSEETQARLLQVAAELQARFGRRISYDEAISVLIDEAGGLREARTQFEKLFGSLRGEKRAWNELRGLKEEEKQRLERLPKHSR